MFGDKGCQLCNGFDTGVFAYARAFKAFIIMNGMFFGVGNR